MGYEIGKILKPTEKGEILDAHTREKMIIAKVLYHKDEVINITLPVEFVSSIIETIGEAPNIEIDDIKGINPRKIIDKIIVAIDNKMEGEILNIQSDEGDSIQIRIE